MKIGTKVLNQSNPPMVGDVVNIHGDSVWVKWPDPTIGEEGLSEEALADVDRLPGESECRPGLWAELANGWVVGPFVEKPESSGVYVAFGEGVYQVYTVDQLAGTLSRLVRRVGTRDELVKHG